MLSTLERTLTAASSVATQLARRSNNVRIDPYAMAVEPGSSSYYGPHANDSTLAQEQYQYNAGHVYSAIQIIARRISKQPLLMARVGKPKDKRRSLKSYIENGFAKYELLPQHIKSVAPEDLEIIQNHPLLDAIQWPNELMTRSIMLNVTIASWCVTGRAFWIITDTDNGGHDLVSVPSTWLTPDHQDDKGKLVSQWLLRPIGASEEAEIVIPGNRVVQFYFPDPSDPFGAISPLQAQARSILTDDSISTTQYKMFKNAINPGMAVMVGEAATGDGKRQMKLDPFQRRQLMTWIKQEFQGAEQFGQPIILDAIIRDVKQLMNKPMEMSFKESGSWVKTRIFEGFGVNPISAGQVEGSNRASSGVADHHMVSNTVNPMLDMMGEIVTVKAVPIFARGNDRIKAWFAPCEAYDPDLTLKKYDLGLKYGFVTRNEGRVGLFGLPPREGMDDVAISNRVVNQPAGELSDPDSPTPASEPDPDRDPDEIKSLSFVPAGKIRDTSDEPELRSVKKAKSPHSRWLKVHGEYERAMAKPLSAFIRDQVETAASKIETLPHSLTAADVIAPELWTDALKIIVKPFLTEQGYAGAALQLVELKSHKATGFDFHLPANITNAVNDAIDGILDYGYWDGISETTLDDIARQLKLGLQNNETNQELAERVRDALGVEYYTGRAAAIARTETTGAMNCGQFTALNELAEEGIVESKEWLPILDSDTRDAHYEMTGERAIVPVNEPFDVGGYPAMYPGDPSLPARLRVNCRCALNGVIGDVKGAKRKVPLCSGHGAAQKSC